MPKVILSAGIGLALAFRAFGAEVVSLDTERTSLVFETGDSPEGTRLYLRHYGARVTDKSSVCRTAWRSESSSEVGYETPTAYTAFGDATGARNTFNGYNPYGGLAVIHADGCLTSDLVVERLERTDETLAIHWKDAFYPFRATQFFRARKDADVIETHVVLENGEASAVRLPRMASLTLAFPLVADRFSVQTTPGQWTCENQLAESELARGQTVSIGSRSGVRGAWGSNPSFMVSIGGTADETSGNVIGVALCWSGVWEASVRRSHTDFLEIDAGACNCAGPYVLGPGQRLELPTVALTYSAAGKGRVSRNMHRWARRHRMPHGTQLRDVVLNSFYATGFGFDETSLLRLMDGAKELGVETFVLDDGWFGNGRYARDDDRRGLGDWTVNGAKLPRGLDFMCGEAKRRGMKFGLWVEPEMANTNSEFYARHPDWVLRERNRRLRVGRGDSQVVVDLANPAARNEVWRQIDAAYASVPDLAYVKWDANADFMNPGSPYLAADRQSNVFFDYAAGYLDLMRRQRKSRPDLTVQACASGGGHTDYASLGFCDEFWASDTIDPRERVMIQWGASQFYPAGAMACHIAVDPFRKVPFKYRADVACSGRLGVEMKPTDLSEADRKFLVSVIADYKRIRPVVQQGDLHRLVSPCDHDHAALMYVAEDRRRAVVFVYGLSRQQRRDFPPPLILRGLDADARYVVRELNMPVKATSHARLADGKTPVSGEALMTSGLPFVLGTADYDSAVFELMAESVR